MISCPARSPALIEFTIRVAHETGVTVVVVVAGGVVVEVGGAVVEGGTVGTVDEVGLPALVVPGADELGAAAGGVDEQAAASVVSPTTTTAGQSRPSRRERGRRSWTGTLRP
jgi:hypothetical protein